MLFSGFGDKEFYPSKEEKGARLGYYLISNHPFVDGNKRVGVYVMLIFLEVNGIQMQYTDKDVIDVGLLVADGSMPYEKLVEWVLAHKKALTSYMTGNIIYVDGGWRVTKYPFINKT